MDSSRDDHVLDSDSEDEFIVIRSKKVLLKDRVQQLMSDNEVLEYSKRSLEIEVKDKKREIGVLSQLNTQLDIKLKSAEEERQRMASRVLDLEARVRPLTDHSSEGTQTEDNRDLETENKVLKNKLQDLERKCIAIDNKNKTLMDELLENDKNKLKTKLEIEELNRKLDEMKNSFTEPKIDNYERGRDLQELRSNFQMVCEESDRLTEENTRLENQLNRIKGKVKKYLDVKSSTESDPYMSATLCYSLMSRTEAELKEAIDKDMKSNDKSKTRRPVTSDHSLGSIFCIICDQTICCDPSLKRPLLKHYEDEHWKCFCPICKIPFDLTREGHSLYLQMHFDNHFDIPYPYER